jgi:hypothetical protein
MVQLSIGFTQTVIAVVIARGIRSRLRGERFIVAGFDYFVDLAIRLLVIQVVNFFLARARIRQILFAIHGSSVSSHAIFLLIKLESFKLYGKLVIPFHGFGRTCTKVWCFSRLKERFGREFVTIPKTSP